jgi:glycosyltransferase A (GT-A) superfamily protein (DUF2064 family)
MTGNGMRGVNGAGAATVLIMARAPRRGEVRRALEPVIGADACMALQAALLVQAGEWARNLGVGEIYAAYEPADAGPMLQMLFGDGVHLFPQNGDGIAGRLADAAGRVFGHGRGPLLIVWPELPELRPAHGRAALADLAAGVDVVLGPVFDGGFYLVGIPRPMPRLFGLPEQFWRSADSLSLAVAAGDGQKPLEVGLIRAERPLHRPADLRAALADPLLPATVARALGRR